MSFKQRREKFGKSLPDYSLALVYSGNPPYRVGDETYDFDVDRDFYYLTGIDREKMILVIWKTPRGVDSFLFIERFDEFMAKWVGPKLRPEECCEISGIDQVMYLDEFETTLADFFNSYEQEMTLYPVLRREEIGAQDSWLTKEVNRIARHYPTLPIKQASNYLTELRMIKDDDEIAQIKQGIHTTNLGLQRMWTNLHSGMNEAEAEAWFNFEVVKARNSFSFKSIFASGVHATTLHYSQNNSVIHDDALLLTDLGAAKNHYCADITRTVPASGKFTKRQREVYDVVLRGNRHIIDYAKTGMTLRDLNNELVSFYKHECPKIDLLKHGQKMEDIYFHGVSHMLGLQCHDVSTPGYKIQDGNVFTVEPGLYLEKEKIGIRIEDNIVMKGGKAQVLSSEIIKNPDEIEAFFANR